MATSNFATTDAKAVYVLPDYEDNTFMYDHDSDELHEDLKNTFKHKCYYVTEIEEHDGGNSYPGTYKSIVEYCKHYAHHDIIIQFRIGMRSGYYHGTNWDYEISTDVDSDHQADYYSVEDLPENQQDMVNDKIITIQNKLEKLLENHSEKYNKVATFSNGEAIYEKA